MNEQFLENVRDVLNYNGISFNGLISEITEKLQTENKELRRLLERWHETKIPDEVWQEPENDPLLPLETSKYLQDQ